MASITMPPPGIPDFSHTSLTSPMERNSPPFETHSPLPSPPGGLNSAFTFPERRSFEQERSAPMAPVAMPVTGGSHGRQRSRQGRPALPAFTFNPGAEMAEITPTQPSPTSPKTHPVLEQMAANSQMATSGPRMRAARPAALPPFNFNPGVASELSTTPSPTKSAFGDPSQRPSHRRGDSEFVGVEGSAPIMSTSPVKSDNKMPKGPPVTNHPARGHKHRRSGAMSQADIDLSSIIKANAMAKHRGASAPSTPADVNSPTFFEHASASSPASPNSRKSALATPPSSPGRRGSLPSQAQRPRVAFSETVAEIPRPLSMISSATEDSTSTIRASHSASNSVNSFTFPARSGSSLSISREECEEPQRPRSADAACTAPQTENVRYISASPKRPLSASGSPSPSSTTPSPPFKKKHFWSATSSNDGDDEDGNILDMVDASESDLPEFSPSASQEISRPRTSPERKASLKKRKVKTSIGGIFSRKGKHRSSRIKSRRTPTPPLIGSGADPVFDNDDTVVIEDPAIPRSKLPLLETQPRAEDAHSTNDKSFGGSDRGVVSPVIDLDAALGPFGSDERFTDANPSPAAWRRMHSGKGLADPTNIYHRRAESAPHLPPVNRSGFGFSRMGSNPSMSEQAIDEEEEDQYLASAAESATSGDESSQPDQSEKVEDLESTEALPIEGKSSSSLSKSIDREPEDDMQEGTRLANNRSSGSTIMAPISNDFFPRRPVSAPMDLAVSMAHASYPSSAGGRSGAPSMISSPEADRLSFSRYVGDHSHEQFPKSTDDVPSLTDSVSTATGHVPRISSSANTRSSTDQRSASFSGFAPWAPSARTSKRASLVSLTRLIPGSSHGEKSKLRFGQTAQDDEQEKQQKRKSNRLSRLMTFWRPKERS